MLYVFVSPQCEMDAARIGMSADLAKLKEKLEGQQSTAGLQRHPTPFLKKPLGKTRIIIAEVLAGDDVILCFLRHVFKHEIGENYEAFFGKVSVPNESDPELIDFLRSAREIPVDRKCEANDAELAYLHPPRAQTGGGLTVLESATWTKAIRTIKDTPGKAGLLTPIWEIVEKICSSTPERLSASTEWVHDRYPVRVHYRHFPQEDLLFLIWVGDSGDNLDLEARNLVDASAGFDYLSILRNATRAYPDFVVVDRTIWETTQNSLDANLALSPEESDVLNHVLQSEKEGGFPLFINGRPGSGKSTILQYLFAEYLHAHLARIGDQRLSHPPLYLTYNDGLLQEGKKVVEDIFRCGAVKLAASETVVLTDPTTKAQFDSAFGYFREFLRALLPSTAGFERRGYVDFNRFRSLYATLLQGPDAKLRKLSPEVVWHTLRTYIKGKSPGGGDYFDPTSYSELPRNEITVESTTYELVWDKVWNGWYRGLCEKEGHWDDQDLARHILDSELAPSVYPAVFCDEAQDFTTVELELIFRLSLFSGRRVDSHYLSHIPFAFAGDPFQTLNPTGFRWEAIKSNFHSNIVTQLDPAGRSRVKFNFKELAYNYRSTGNIVRFCNLIQLHRATLFQLTEVEPQKAWALDEGGWPAYFEVSDLSCQTKLQDQSELVIVVPCQEGEEKSFIQSDDFLKTFALNDKGEVTRNVLSPMRAKGLEFARVVLYKFGEQAVSEGRTSKMAQLAGGRGHPLKREDTLGLEYFLNGLYVGASRAQKKLLVVDTERGLTSLWAFATNPAAPATLLTERRRKNWSEGDIGHMVRGGAATWSEDRDDPRQQADRFYQQGVLERSAYLLQLARNQYMQLGAEELRERCTALIADIEGDYRVAGESYLRFNELVEAVRCFWEAGENQRVLDVGQKDIGTIGNSPYFLGAQFLLGQRSEESVAKFIRALSAALTAQQSLDVGSARWATIIDSAVDSLTPLDVDESVIAPPWAREMFASLISMRDRYGLAVKPSGGLAVLAFKAGDHRQALDIWEDVAGERPASRKDAREPSYIIKARATVSAYPEKLKWLDMLDDARAILAEYQRERDFALTPEDQDIVFRALVKLDPLEGALAFIRREPKWGAVKFFAQSLGLDSRSKQSAIVALALMIRTGVNEGRHREIIDLIDKPESNEIPALAAALKSQSIRDRGVAAIIRMLARSERLSHDKADVNYVGGFLHRWGVSKQAAIQNHVSAKELGAAIERTPRVLDALKFYESIFDEKLWGADRELHEHAKTRWLKSKFRQADADQKKKVKLLREAEEKSHQWGIKIPTDQYPTLPPIGQKELEDLLAFSADGGETGNQPPSTPTSLVPKEPSAGPAPKHINTDLIPDIPVLDGHVDSTFSLSGRMFELRAVRQKRRIEIRSRDTQDLVMVRARDRVVESHDTTVSKKGNAGWVVSDWGMELALLSVGNIELVDVTSLDGERVLCQTI